MPFARGDVAVITGAGSGIGRELALQLASQYGCRLALCDIAQDNLEQTRKLTGLPLEDCLVDVVDVSNRMQMDEWRDRVLKHFDGQVNHLFNNAGVTLVGNVQGPDAVTREDFEWIVRINFWGVVNGCEAFLPTLVQYPGSSIVSLSSVFGLVGVPGQAPYCATKFAVRGYTESLRNELQLEGQTNLNVICVHPGGIQTSIVRNARRPQGSGSVGTKQSEALGLKHRRQATGADDAEDSDEAAIAEVEKYFMTPAPRAAEVILRGAHRGRRRILVGPDSGLFDWAARLFPETYFDHAMGLLSIRRNPTKALVAATALLVLLVVILFHLLA